jgi:hypothetical protein
MKYQISTYVLLVILAGMIIYSCGNRDGSSGSTDLSVSAAGKDEGDDANLWVISQELAAELKARPYPKKAKVSWKDAQKDLKKYKTEMGIDCDSNDPKNIYGFTFKLGSFLEFVEDVKKINTTHRDSIQGIRVYLSMKNDTIPGTNNLEQRMDIFLMPVDKNKKSIYPVDDCVYKEAKVLEEDDSVVLNTSVPCPNRCE